jgi:hypothetical protein
MPTTPAAAAAPTPTATLATEQVPIEEVYSVDVTVFDKTNPPSAVITAKGNTKTSGWKNVELQPLPNIAPEIGMRSFVLVGTRPTGFTTQVLSPVTASITITPLPENLKTIRVLSKSVEIAQPVPRQN